MTDERRQAITRAIAERFSTTEAGRWSVGRTSRRRPQPFRSGSVDQEDAYLRAEQDAARRPEFIDRWPDALRGMGDDGRLPRPLAVVLAAALQIVLLPVWLARELGGEAIGELLVFVVLLPLQIVRGCGLTVLRMAHLIPTRMAIDLHWRPEGRPERVVSHTVVSVRGWWPAGRLVRDLRAHLEPDHAPIDPRLDVVVAEALRSAGADIEHHEHLATGDPRTAA